MLRHKAPYLNTRFSWRTAFYFAGWLFLSWFSIRERRGDAEGPEPAHRKMGAMAGPGLLFWGFSVTFLSIDWVLGESEMVLDDVRIAFHREPGAGLDGVPDRADGGARSGGDVGDSDAAAFASISESFCSRW
jgi:hypothetical protein